MHVYRLQNLSRLQELLLKGRMKPYPEWVFPLGLTLVMVSAFVVSAKWPLTDMQALLVIAVSVLVLGWFRFGPDIRYGYAQRLRNKGLVVLEEDKTYELLQPLIEGYGHVESVREAVKLFSANMRSGEQRFGWRWYIGRTGVTRFLWRILASPEADTPLNAALHECGCWQTVHGHINAIVDEKRRQEIDKVAVRLKKRDKSVEAAAEKFEALTDKRDKDRRELALLNAAQSET